MFNEKSLENLKPNNSKWNNSETCIIRVPKVLKEKILEHARQLDNNEHDSTVTVDSSVISDILIKIENKDKGYKSNSATALIKELKSLV